MKCQHSLVETGLLAIIVINSASLILWTVPHLRPQYGPWFHVIEYIAVAVFVAEFAFRLWVAPEEDPNSPALGYGGDMSGPRSH